MEDAVAIRFTSSEQAGVGTTFECDTRVGPFSLTDLMEVTEWDERKRMGIRHVGLVTGSGRFTLRRARGGRPPLPSGQKPPPPPREGGPPGCALGAPALRRA